MPRSAQDSSSSSYDSDSWSDGTLDSQPDSADLLDIRDNSEDHPNEEAVPERISQQDAVERAFEAKRSSFEEELVIQLCFLHLQHQLQQNYPSRQAAARLREFKRSHAANHSRTLQTTIAGFLSDERAQDMEHMVGAIRVMLQADIPENDENWIRTLAEGPLPRQHVFLQTAQRAIYEGLQPTTGHLSAKMVSDTAVNLAGNALYLFSLRLLWPLIPDDKRLQIQQWILRYRESSEDAGAAEPSSSSGQGADPARG
ncbi:Wdr65 [Symbiodinium sp. CCMP2456]|nr:Wdr65 [Symbiodinium sp. CCMP2456]